MSHDSATQFFHYLGSDQDRMQQISAMSPDELVSYANHNGFPVTLDSLKSSVLDIKSALQSSEELSDADLDKVAGGGLIGDLIRVIENIHESLFPPNSNPTDPEYYFTGVPH